MDCTTYREMYPQFGVMPLAKEIWNSPEYAEWVAHTDDCSACSDWDLGQRVLLEGADPALFPCVHIAYHATMTCEQHPDRRECRDVILTYSERFDEYSIPIRDGGSAGILIAFCPWCGTRLPNSKRDRWFEELEALGLDPDNDLPERYQTGLWYRGAA